MSHGAREHLLLRSFIHVFNRLWPKNRARVSQVSYESLHRLYWDRRQSGLLVFELSPAQTAGLAARCRQHGLSITGALVAAFLLGLDGVQHPLSDVTVAVNIRDRMTQPPGRGMGVYASNINMTIRPKAGTDFWDLAHECHTRIHKMLADPSQILWPLAVGELAPTFADSMLAALSSGQLARRLGPLTRFVKIGGMSPSLDVSNIGRVDLPGVEGPYHLETLLPLPPHWPGGGLALNVLTVNNQMNVILKFRLDQVEAAEVSRIRDRAVDYLTGA